MAADPFSGKTARDVIANLGRIATSLERIADALDTMNANDPMKAVLASLQPTEDHSGAPQEVPRRCRNCELILGPVQWVCPNCGLDNSTSVVTYGADLPESERWRLGQS